MKIMAKNKYSIWIKIVSILIPVVVAVLFTVRIPNVEPLSFLPPIYATINALTAIACYCSWQLNLEKDYFMKDNENMYSIISCFFSNVYCISYDI